jgi:hypothetical protein
MFSKPTTEQVLRGIVDHLNEQIAPELQSEPAKVALGMITQIINGCATRAAHEIEWMFEEMGAIADATGTERVVPDSLHLADVSDAYSRASSVLADAIDAAYSAGDRAKATALRELLKARSAHEMQIVGALDLVGRG